MKLKVDKAGRVVLPKPTRDRLGLRDGSSLEMLETVDGLVLKPVEQRPSMIRKNGLLVHTGTLPEGFDLLRTIEDDREDRIRKVAGL